MVHFSESKRYRGSGTSSSSLGQQQQISGSQSASAQRKELGSSMKKTESTGSIRPPATISEFMRQSQSLKKMEKQNSIERVSGVIVERRNSEDPNSLLYSVGVDGDTLHWTPKFMTSGVKIKILTNSTFIYM